LSNNVVRARDLGDPTGAVATGEGAVWVTRFSAILKVDPATALADENFVHAALGGGTHLPRSQPGWPGYGSSKL
jgi:streptogramin lyase